MERDRVALVTGASSGIGAACARELARRGARVVLVARTRSALEEVADDIEAELGEAHVEPCDCTDADAVEALAERVTATLGTPDVIVNSAGAGRWLFLEETPPGEISTLMDVPFFAAWHVTRAFMAGMLARDSGHICQIGSPYAWMPWPGALGYGTSRWALRGFTEGLAVDLARTGITVSTVIAAEVETEYFRANPGTRERFPKIDRFFPTRTPSDVARKVVWVIEEDRSFAATPAILDGFVRLARHFPRTAKRLAVLTGYQRPA